MGGFKGGGFSFTTFIKKGGSFWPGAGYAGRQGRRRSVICKYFFRFMFINSIFKTGTSGFPSTENDFERGPGMLEKPEIYEMQISGDFPVLGRLTEIFREGVFQR